MSNPNSLDTLKTIRRNFEKASKASHAFVDQTLQNVLTILSVTPGKKKGMSDPNWIQQRNNAIWIDSMNILIQELIVINPEKYWISFSDTQNKDSIRQDIAINSSADIEIALKNILGDIRTQALSKSKQQFVDQYREMNSASLEIDKESSMYIETTFDESIEEHREGITSHIKNILNTYQETQDKRLKRELISLLENQYRNTQRDLQELDIQYESDTVNLSGQRRVLQNTLQEIDLTDASAVEKLRDTANSLETLNRKLQELLSVYEKATEENTALQKRVITEISNLKKEIGLDMKSETALIGASVVTIGGNNSIPTTPEVKTTIQSEIAPEQILNQLAQAFQVAYEEVITTLDERSPERIAYAVAFDTLKNLNTTEKSQRDRVNDFLSTIDASTLLTMSGYEGIYIEKKGLLGRNKTYTLSTSTSLDEVFTKIKIVKAKKGGPQSVAKTDL